MLDKKFFIIKKRGEGDIPIFHEVMTKAELITYSSILLSKVETEFDLSPRREMEIGDFLGHKYEFYRDGSNRILVYIIRMHMHFNRYNIDFGIDDFDDYNIIEEEKDLEAFDDLEELANYISDIPETCIDDLIMEFGKLKALDV